ncbi:hypothetical protein WA026_009666 [Henosepilachna vigintioctopunctata]|uniref:Uncharacterized protein n=1 Tax=Henosepilachna vigintioctopunctata TaxID=420089 RepID=A0AAW1U966_9CUCU
MLPFDYKSDAKNTPKKDYKRFCRLINVLVCTLMKVNLRNLINRDRKTRKSTIYSDTPEKEDMRRKYENRFKRTKAKQVKKRLDLKNTERNAINMKKFSEDNTQQESSSEEEECYCVVCTSSYSESRPEEK